MATELINGIKFIGIFGLNDLKTSRWQISRVRQHSCLRIHIKYPTFSKVMQKRLLGLRKKTHIPQTNSFRFFLLYFSCVYACTSIYSKLITFNAISKVVHTYLLYFLLDFFDIKLKINCDCETCSD